MFWGRTQIGCPSSFIVMHKAGNVICFIQEIQRTDWSPTAEKQKDVSLNHCLIVSLTLFL